MTPERLAEICLALPQAFESFPFSDDLSVFKTSGNGKVFALSALGAPDLSISLKVDPQDGIALREQYPAITPGYHLNKKHWISIALDGSVPDDLVEELVRGSHALVRPKMPRGRVAE